ncbi:unnamed protein product [Closterium sp. Naga37s-1]|nr:unnamed protein product [Closterium sp. Naga37s-1]
MGQMFRSLAWRLQCNKGHVAVSTLPSRLLLSSHLLPFLHLLSSPPPFLTPPFLSPPPFLTPPFLSPPPFLTPPFLSPPPFLTPPFLSPPPFLTPPFLSPLPFLTPPFLSPPPFLIHLLRSTHQPFFMLTSFQSAVAHNAVHHPAKENAVVEREWEDKEGMREKSKGKGGGRESEMGAQMAVKRGSGVVGGRGGGKGSN